MPNLDRQFSDYRARAMKTPLTRAKTLALPALRLAGGISMALSVNN